MEKIGVREAGRRLGVSDTAVRKAIKAGRVTVVGENAQGWPLVGWPQARDEWLANSDTQKRSHVGSRGSDRRDDAPQVHLATSDAPDEAPAPVNPVPAASPVPAQPLEQDVSGDDLPGRRQPQGPSYAQSRAVREAYQARLAKLEYEQKSGKLVNADEVKAAWFKQIKAAQTRVMGIPAACKSRCSDLPLQVVATIEAICRETLEDLANGVDR